MDREESSQLTPRMPRRRQARQLPRATREELQVARKAIRRLIMREYYLLHNGATNKLQNDWSFGVNGLVMLTYAFDELDTPLTEDMEWLWYSGFNGMDR